MACQHALAPYGAGIGGFGDAELAAQNGRARQLGDHHGPARLPERQRDLGPDLAAAFDERDLAVCHHRSLRAVVVQSAITPAQEYYSTSGVTERPAPRRRPAGWYN